jgi:MFS family permease
MWLPAALGTSLTFMMSVVGLSLPEMIILKRRLHMPQEKQYAKSRLILYTVMIGAFMSMFDSGVVNVGLPVIAGQFRSDINAVQWIASVYLLVMSALLPILGTVADHFGRRKIYNTGFFVISIFTLFCGFSANLSMLIVMRILQAVGGAMVMANGITQLIKNIGMVIGIAFSVSLFTAFFGTSPIHDGSAFLQSAKYVYI